MVERVIAIFDSDGDGEIDFQGAAVSGRLLRPWQVSSRCMGIIHAEFIKGISMFSTRGDRKKKLECVCNGGGGGFQSARPAHSRGPAVAFKIYDVDKDGYISNAELFQVLKLMVGSNLKDVQLQQVRLPVASSVQYFSRVIVVAQIVDKSIIYADKDGDGRVSFDEFCAVVGSSDVDEKMVLPDI